MKRKPKTKNLALDEMRMMWENRKALLGHHCPPHEHNYKTCGDCMETWYLGKNSHPSPAFIPHVCGTQWPTHVAYFLFIILTVLLCFMWGLTVYCKL